MVECQNNNFSDIFILVNNSNNQLGKAFKHCVLCLRKAFTFLCKAVYYFNYISELPEQEREKQNHVKERKRRPSHLNRYFYL